MSDWKGFGPVDEDGVLNINFWVTDIAVGDLISAPAPARLNAISVTFEPGARTNWHTHPLGQTLVVTAGAGLAQKDGDPIQTLRPGDVIWFEPGEKHWHGAAPDCAMTHIALQEQVDGSAADWLEPVTDAQYSPKT